MGFYLLCIYWIICMLYDDENVRFYIGDYNENELN